MEEIDFRSGRVKFVLPADAFDENDDEDLLSVEYPNGFHLFLSWSIGRKIFSVEIKRDMTEYVTYVTHNRNMVVPLLSEAIERVERESRDATPYYGTLWKAVTIIRE